MKVLLSCSIIFGFASSYETESRIVPTAQGPVRGYKDPVENIYVFYGIPYAHAPTGSDKFKAPIAATPRNVTFEAVDRGIICHQKMKYIHKIKQEDCLITNIYVPNTNETNLSVLVYVHGGYFLGGYGDVLKPKKIVSTKKIIVLNFNYRIGAHGFLCLGTRDIPGNAGLKDQVALLRWVQENIAYFGGNPKDVTITGYSAGSSAVGLLQISKMASGLFSKLIQESGDVGSPFVMQINPTQNAKEYAKLLQFDNVHNISSLEFFYKNISVSFLQSGRIVKTDFSTIVSPCVERDVGQEMFLDNSPENLLRSGNFTNLPMLIGFTDMEGIVGEKDFDQLKDRMNEDFSSVVPVYLGFSSNKEKQEIANQIKTFYFGNNVITNKNILNYIDILTDCGFACPCLKTIRQILLSGNPNIYLFYYSFVDEASTAQVKYTNVRGAQHIAETYAILDGVNGTHNAESQITNKLRDWKIIMREAWSNFVIHGVPASTALPEWKPVTTKSLTYMALKESSEIGKSPRKYSCSFWNKLYDNYYQQPSPPEVTPSF